MADGSVVFSVDMDDKAVEKKLNDLRRDIEKTAKSIDTGNAAKSGIEKQLDDARQAAQELQKELDSVTARRAEVAKQIGGYAVSNRQGVAVDPVAWQAAKDEAVELDAKAAELAPKIQIAQKDVAKLKKEEAKVNDKLTAQEQQLEALKDEYGETAKAAESINQGANLREAVDQASASIRKGFKNILKWGFGIRSVFILMRKLRNAIKEGVNEFAKADPATKAAIDGIKNSLTGLKASFGAAFAPLLQAIAPILQKIIGWLTTAANAVQQFFAVLSGRTTYKRAIAANNDLADSYTAAGGAAKDAQKQFLGFDEIDKLNEESSGGGGGGATEAAKVEWEEMELDAWTQKVKPIIEWVKEHLDDILWVAKQIGIALLAWKLGKGLLTGVSSLVDLFAKGGFLKAAGFTIAITGLALEIGAIEDIFKNGMNGKNFAKLIAGALLTTAGAALLGKAFGNWIAGACIGAAVAAIGLIIAGMASAWKDGINWLNASVITVGFTGLGAAIGGLVGSLGGPITAGMGALIGLAAGAIATGITAIATQTRKAANDLLKDSELWNSLQASKERIAEMLSSSEELVVKVTSISADVDEATLANLGAAAKLIDEIFNLDEQDNKTAEEIAVLQQKIETLNALGLPGVNLAFDEATGHVQGTRAEVMGLLEDLKQQYQLEAMKQAYVDYYRAQSDAEIQLTQYKAEREAREAELTQATREQEAAQRALNDATAAYTQAKIDLDVDGMERWGKAVKDAEAALLAAKDTTKEAQDQYDKVSEAIENAEKAIAASAENIAMLDEKFTEVSEAAAKSGEDTATGFAQGVTDNAYMMEDALTDASEDGIEAIKNTWDSHSPSRVTEQLGGDIMDGFAVGVNAKRNVLVDALIGIMDEAKNIVANAVSELSAMWQTDWGKPTIRIPIFQLSGKIDFATGQVPQLGIAGWQWLAKGGILDRATLIGAGEAGKEAIVPLERNTQWIGMVADGMLDNMLNGNRFADFISDKVLPLISGQIVPPRAAAGGGILGDNDIARLVSGIVGALGGNGDGKPIYNVLQIDGRAFAEIMTREQRGMGRSYGI